MGSPLPANRAAFTAAELARLTGGSWLAGGADIVGVTTDSRQAGPGQLFVALSGEHFDGHDFLEPVAAAGAAAAIVKVPRGSLLPQLVVADPLAALARLARAHRDRFDIPVIGLTGSNGKTTSKEMIAAVLSSLGPIHRTAGNLNNHIGVPLTLLGLESSHRAAVVEMGMSREGEIRDLSAMVRPTVAVITNAGRAHLLGLGSREAVGRAKSEIAEALGPSDTLIYFGDDGLLRELNKGRAARVVTFGLGPTPNLSASRIVETGLSGSEFDVDGFGRVRLAIPGRHNVLNALAALAVSQVLGVAPSAAVLALAEVNPVNGRMEVRHFGPLTIIDDSYNANPDSMRAALDLLREAPHGGRRVAVLGEMLELGQSSLSMHREVGAAASFVDALWVIGPSASEVAAAAVEAGLAGSAVHVFPNLDALLASVPPMLLPGDLVLVKGSRGMALDRLVSAIELSMEHTMGGGADMLLWLLYPLHQDMSIFNVIRYITFRSAYAGVTALLLSFVLGPPLIRWLRQVRMRQIIRRDGPSSHYTKEGTPTMGGLLILAAIVIPTLLWGNLENRLVLIALGSTLWLGAVGFLDDWLKIQRGSKGLLGRYKMVAQLALGLGLGSYIYLNPVHPTATTVTSIPFLKNVFLDLGIFYIPFVALVITGASNAVNLTDGLDGLATGTAAMAAAAFAGLAYLSGHARFSEYLNILFVREAGELTVFLAAMVGASLGFLWFNTHPASVFMGDTGSLALGGALGTVAVLIKREFLLVVIGGIFVLEALSVILQVASFKLRQKRILKMAPLHHHFELSGWAETKVVVRFWIVAALFALLSLSTLKLQ